MRLDYKSIEEVEEVLFNFTAGPAFSTCLARILRTKYAASDGENLILEVMRDIAEQTIIVLHHHRNPSTHALQFADEGVRLLDRREVAGFSELRLV